MTDFPVPPLTAPRVRAFGRTLGASARFEPLWAPDGRLVGLELLTRLTDTATGAPVAPALFFNEAPASCQASLLAWQLALLAQLAPWRAARGVVISLNLSRPLAQSLLAAPQLCDTLLTLRAGVRLEISEHFLTAGDRPEEDPLLAELVALAPLWLDDFGAGATGLSWLMSGVFEAVKLDRGLFTDLAALEEGRHFLRAVTAFADSLNLQVIAEGVADAALWQRARTAGVTLCQGFRWPGVPPKALGDLPAWLPDITAQETESWHE